MKRGFEDGGALSGARRRTNASLGAKYGLKALVPDAFASFLLRDRGTAKEQLQEESGTRLVFSNKGDFFPETLLRVLGVYADTADSVMLGLELVLGRMRELAEDEQSRPPPPGCEMLGKEEGEYIFRIILPRDLTGLLIGSQGANIKEMRRLSGAKIVIRDDTIAGHRLVTLTGGHDNLVEALRRVGDYVQTEADTDEFQQYLRVINFGEVAGHEGPGVGGGYENSGKGGGYRHQHPLLTPISAMPRLEPQASKVLHLLAEDLGALPRGAAEMAYSFGCALPAQLVPALIGKAGELIRSVEERTGAKIDISRDPIPGRDGLRKMELVGPLLSVYAAHTLMMQRLQEVEPTPPAAARRPDRPEPRRGGGHGFHTYDGPRGGRGARSGRQKELEAMVADLERKLSEARAMP